MNLQELTDQLCEVEAVFCLDQREPHVQIQRRAAGLFPEQRPNIGDLDVRYHKF